MFIRGETLSAHSARPTKIPRWIELVRDNISVNKGFTRVFVSFLFQILHLDLKALPKTLENNST